MTKASKSPELTLVFLKVLILL